MSSHRADEMGKALIGASARNDLNEIRKQLRMGADVEYLLRLMNQDGELSTTPLIIASGLGHLSAVTLLIESGADVNKQEPCVGYTSLHASTQDGRFRVIQFLISKGARVNVRNRDGSTPLHMIAFNGHKEAAIYLLNHGAEVNAAKNDGLTPLMLAVQQTHLPLVDLFLLRGADPNLKETIHGQTALHIATFDGHFDFVDHLVKGGADVNQVCKLGSSPLHSAAQEGHLKIAKLLVKKGASIHQSNVYGLTSLHLASLYGRTEVFDYLIKKGANFDDQGNAVGKACKCCGATDVPVFKCAGCKVVWYCSPECQKKDWKERGENKHKIQCPRIKEQRELYEEKKKEIKNLAENLDREGDGSN